MPLMTPRLDRLQKISRALKSCPIEDRIGVDSTFEKLPRGSEVWATGLLMQPGISETRVCADTVTQPYKSN